MKPHRGWRIRAGARDLTLLRARDVSAALRARVVPPALLGFQLRDAAADTRNRRALLVASRSLLGIAYGADHALLARLERAISSGEVVALEPERRRVLVPLGAGPEPLGPAPEPPPAPDDYLEVLLFDSTGHPVPSPLDPLPVTFDAQLAGRRIARGLPVTNGAGGIAVIESGAPSACTLSFHGLEIDPADPIDPVPPEADACAPPRFDLVDAASLRGPRLETKLVTRRELAKLAQPASLDATNVFQLRRREAEVMEIEHFHDGSAVFLPGAMPDEVYRTGVTDRPSGVAVLEACLLLAEGRALDRILVTGHDAKLSQRRADGVRALLTGDRDAWVAISDRHHVFSADQDAIVRWAMAAFSWPADPDAGRMPDSDQRSVVELRRFQRSYNADLEAGLFAGVPGAPHAKIPELGVIGPKTWGAMFDCVMRALLSPPSDGREAHAFILVDRDHQTYPVELAQIAAPRHDAARWTDLDPLNPDMVLPNGGGWRAPQVGQRIYIPDDWSLAALGAAGYATFPKEQPDPVPFSPPPLLPAPGPAAVGCGAHHLTTPFAKDARRRARTRRAEVVFLDETSPIVACGEGDGQCAAANCELYDPREHGLRYVSTSEVFEGAVLVVQFPIAIGAVSAMPHVYTLESQDGAIRRTRKLATEAQANGADRAELHFGDLPEGRKYRLTCVELDEPYTVVEYTRLRDLDPSRSAETREADQAFDAMRARYAALDGAEVTA